MMCLAQPSLTLSRSSRAIEEGALAQEPAGAELEEAPRGRPAEAEQSGKQELAESLIG